MTDTNRTAKSLYSHCLTPHAVHMHLRTAPHAHARVHTDRSDLSRAYSKIPLLTDQTSYVDQSICIVDCRVALADPPRRGLPKTMPGLQKSAHVSESMLQPGKRQNGVSGELQPCIARLSCSCATTTSRVWDGSMPH